MTLTLRVNTRNDIHLPSELLHYLNIGEDRILKVVIKNNAVILIPVDLEPRFSHEDLTQLDKLHKNEKKKGWFNLNSDKDIEKLLE